MNPLLLCLMMVAGLATPLELSLALSVGEGATGQARLSVWGIPLHWAFRTHQEGGRLRLMVRGRRLHTGEHQAQPITSARVKVWLGTLLRTDKARKCFFNGVHLTEGDVKLRLALSDAAKTAVLSGALTTLGGWLPDTLHLRVIPDFWSEHSAFSMRLALATRLGTLVLTAVLMLVAWLGERAEHPQHKEGT